MGNLSRYTLYSVITIGRLVQKTVRNSAKTLRYSQNKRCYNLAMTNEERLEMFHRQLDRTDFDHDHKQLVRKNIRRLRQEMDEPICAADDYCVEQPTSHLMRNIWICKTHEQQGVVTASCTRCAHCSAWVILFPRATMPEPHIYEFKCPAEHCGEISSIGNNQTSLWKIPVSWKDRGFFYDREMREL